MVVRIKLTKEHLKLIPFFFIKDNEKEVLVDRDEMFSLGSHLLEDMSVILGLEDKAIVGTENSPNGRAFEADAENHMLELYKYISDNLYYIESLIHQFVTKGGLTEGEYKCLDNVLIWEKI